VRDLETSRMRRPWSELGRRATKKNSIYIKNEVQELGKDNRFGLEGMEYGFIEKLNY